MASEPVSTQAQAPGVTKPKGVSALSAGIAALVRDRRGRWRVILPAIVVLAALSGAAYYQFSYVPAHAVVQAPLQTTVAFRGDLTVSAAGTGVLQAANEVQLGFGTSGKLAVINVKPGDPVKSGQLLAQLDNTAEQVKYQQAQRALADLTSRTSIAQAQLDVATATTSLTNAKYALIYLISPAVFASEQQVLADQQALADAQAAGGTSPSSDQQKTIESAQAQLTADQATLAGNQQWYKDHYLPLYFTVFAVDPNSTSNSHRPSKHVESPSDLEIETAQANYAVAKTGLQQAEWYLDALSGRDVPANAGGSKLQTFQNAKFAVQTAKATLDGTQLYAPMSGTIETVSAQVGDNVGTTAIIVMGDLTHLYVKAYVNEKDYQMFQVGSEADVVFDALPGDIFTGKVIQVDPGLDTSTNTPVVSGLVEMDPTKANLLMGMSASVDVIVGRAHQAVLIPLAALHEYAPGKYAVFVKRSGKLTVDFVDVGLKDQVNAEIKSGVHVGDVLSTGILGTKQQ